MMLHITNGDSVANKLRQGVVQGEIMAWREIYTVGPVFRNMAERGNRETRARYLERRLGIPQADYLKIEEQEQILRDLKNTTKSSYGSNTICSTRRCCVICFTALLSWRLEIRR